jgi:hypothetical protein
MDQCDFMDIKPDGAGCGEAGNFLCLKTFSGGFLRQHYLDQVKGYYLSLRENWKHPYHPSFG